ncbi:MAG TPA: twin-arginine translocase TatA/TatE family subunit [Acidimicrobiia bacterium]
MSLGPAEILVVLVLALVVFGPKRLPEVGRQVGGALRELRKVQQTVESEIRGVLDDTTGPVRSMFDAEPVANHSVPSQPALSPPAPDQPRAGELPAAEPDLGDEHPRDPAASNDTGIDGLSGGTFS